MGAVRGRKSARNRGPVESIPPCGDCGDDAAVLFAGELYCGRCALRHLIIALQREAQPTDSSEYEGRELIDR